MATATTGLSSGADPTLSQAAARLQAALDADGSPGGFSDESLGVLLERQSEYVEELGLEAIRLARRSRADIVSAIDVEKADEAVRSNEGARRGRVYESVGGVLLGGGLGQLYAQIALADDATTVGWVVAALSGVLGLVLMTYVFARR